MNETSRRDLCFSLAAMAALSGVRSEAQASSQVEEPKLDHSEVFPFDKLPVKASASGGASRAVMHGTLATGEFVEVHETTLPPGQMPHPPHRHTHSEIICIREGSVEVMSEGQQGVLGPGSVLFTASGVLHSMKNVGTVPANYFVVAVGIQKVLA